MEVTAIGGLPDKRILRYRVPLLYKEWGKNNNKTEMNRRYQVRWYHCNLTEPMSRNFFTEVGAALFKAWLSLFKQTESIIYERI